MPKYQITSPDGKKYEITAPEGATQEQVLQYAKSHYGSSPKAPASPVLPPQYPAPPHAPSDIANDIGGALRTVGHGVGTVLGYPQKKVEEWTGLGSGTTLGPAFEKLHDIINPQKPLIADLSGGRYAAHPGASKQEYGELGKAVAKQASDPLTYLGLPIIKGGKAALKGAQALRGASKIVPEAEKAAEAVSKVAAPAAKPRFRLGPEGLKPINTEAEVLAKTQSEVKAAAEGAAMPEGSIGDLKGASAPGKPPAMGFLKRVQEMIDKKFKVNLPAHPQILKEAPNSPVISITQARSVAMSNDMAEVAKQPWIKLLWEGGREGEFNEKFKVWETNGFADAPEDVKQVIKYLQSKRADEKWAARFLGDRSLIDESQYWPHISLQDMDHYIRISRVESGVVKGFRTTLGMFEKSRKYKTMEEGIKHGVEYADARRALLVRLWNSTAMVNTAKFVEDMEKAGVISRKAIRGGTRVQGIPGEVEWWTKTRAEARYLEQQLTDPRSGGMAYAAHFLNTWVRLPNLINPLPHTVRNIGFKYLLAGGNPARVAYDVGQFLKGTDPLVARFRGVMPFEKEGQTSSQIYQRMLGQLSSPRLTALKERTLTLNRMSSKLVFSKADPAMKYSLWKKYIRKGMSDQEAANHVQIDLIDYGTRSNWIDIWKSWPANFFVNWRYGTVMALVKQAKYHPIRTVMVVGALDYMREELYRRTGWWMHFPTDYIEGTVAQVERHGIGGAVSALVSTVLLGPGGTTYSLETMLRALHSSNMSDVIKGMTGAFWGLTLLGSDVTKSVKEFHAWQQDHDPKHIKTILELAVLGLVVGAHKPGYEPARLIGPAINRTQYTDPGARMNKEKQRYKQIVQDYKNKQANKMSSILHQINQTFGGR